MTRAHPRGRLRCSAHDQLACRPRCARCRARRGLPGVAVNSRVGRAALAPARPTRRRVEPLPAAPHPTRRGNGSSTRQSVRRLERAATGSARHSARVRSEVCQKCRTRCWPVARRQPLTKPSSVQSRSLISRAIAIQAVGGDVGSGTSRSEVFRRRNLARGAIPTGLYCARLDATGEAMGRLIDAAPLVHAGRRLRLVRPRSGAAARAQPRADRRHIALRSGHESAAALRPAGGSGSVRPVTVATPLSRPAALMRAATSKRPSDITSCGESPGSSRAMRVASSWAARNVTRLATLPTSDARVLSGRRARAWVATTTPQPSPRVRSKNSSRPTGRWLTDCSSSK